MTHIIGENENSLKNTHTRQAISPLLAIRILSKGFSCKSEVVDEKRRLIFDCRIVS